MGQIYRIGRGGLEPLARPEDKNNLPVGTVLQLEGYDCPQYVITGNEGVNDRFPEYGAMYKLINLTTLLPEKKDALCLEWIANKKDGRIQTYIMDEIKTPAEVKTIQEQSRQRIIEKEKEDKEIAEQNAREFEDCKKRYPYLEKLENTKKSYWAIGAKNLRTELAREFPGVKFAVRSESYTGGDSINIDWTDGPTSEAVKAISDKYQKCDFDAMQDLQTYRHSDFTAIYGGAHYVFENRSISSEKVIEAAEKYGYTITTDQWGRIISGLEDCPDKWEMERAIRREAHSRSYYTKPEAKEPGPVQKPEGVTIRKNEERDGIEVLFPTKPEQGIIDKLKGLGFRWSKFQGLWWRRYDENIFQELQKAI